MSNHAVRPPRSHLANMVDAMPDTTPVPWAADRVRTAPLSTSLLVRPAAGWLCRIVGRSHVHGRRPRSPTPCRYRKAPRAVVAQARRVPGPPTVAVILKLPSGDRRDVPAP